MYESPIEIVYKDLSNQMNFEFDAAIYKAVREVGINIDKQELIKAIQYDRGQYSKGYEDARNEIKKNLVDTIDMILEKWALHDEQGNYCGFGIKYTDLMETINKL